MSNRQTSANNNDNDTHLVPSVIKSIVGPNAQIFRLPDFLQSFAPSLQVHWQETPTQSERRNALLRRLSNTLVSPSPTLQPMAASSKLISQSLSTLVDDVIQSLVNNKNNNVLSKGYVVASERLERQVTPCAPGVISQHMSGTAFFCKKSWYFQTLHQLIGDDLMRVLLLKTSMFVPLAKEEGNATQNYTLVCGALPKTSQPLLPACKSDVTYVSPKQPHQPQSTTDMAKKTTRKRKRTEKTNSSEKDDILPQQAQPTTTAKKTNRKRKRKRATQKAKPEEQTNSQTPLDPLGPNTPIHRKSLFYSDAYIPKVGLPKTHILNQTPHQPETLLEHMIPMRKDKGKKRRKRWNRLRVWGPSMCREILQRHKKCDYHRTLDKHCPLPEFAKKKRQYDGQQDEVTLSQLSAAHTDSDSVIAFLGSVIRVVFPEAFWGSSHNLSRVLQVVATFVKLRRREDLANKTLMKGIRVTDFQWLQAKTGGKVPRQEHEALTRLVTMIMRWFFSQFVIPLLRSIFFVTESEFAGKTVLFYRKPVWTMFRSLSVKHLLTKQYKEIPMGEAQKRLQEQQMGCSRLRLLPKTTGVRPIATLCKRDRSVFSEDPVGATNAETDATTASSKRRRLNKNEAWSDQFKSTNDLLRDAFAALKYEHQENANLFGAGLLSLQSFYPRYREFVSKVKQQCKGSSRPKLYFAGVDVRHCYDNIDQDRLMDIVMKVLSEDEYMIRRYSLLHANNGTSQVAKKRKMEVGPPKAFDGFHKLAADGGSKSKGAVFLDEAKSILVNKDKILALTEEHLKSHLVVAKGRYGNRCLLQAQGIPQGSILSSFLCNYYYGDIEGELIGCALENGSSSEAKSPSRDGSAEGHLYLLSRIIDDFQLITTDQAMHKAFLKAMYEGKPSLGVQINKEKIFSNAEVSLNDETGTHTIKDTTSENGGMFPWCGMLFDPQSLEVQIDYSRFEGDKAGNNLTVARLQKEGDYFKKAIKTFVQPRCLPILFDPTINSQETRDASFFDLLLLCALKTKKYIQSGDLADTNASFLISCMEDVIEYSLRVIKDRLQQESAASGAAKLNLPQRLALSLGWNAFHLAFREPKCLGNLASCIRDKLRRLPQCTRVTKAMQNSPQRQRMRK